MLTPPGGSLASTEDVLVAAVLVLAVPPLVALVLPALLVAAPFVGAAVGAASSVGVGLGLAVSAGEVSDAVHGPGWSASHKSGWIHDGAHSSPYLALDVSERRSVVLRVARAMLMTRM